MVFAVSSCFYYEGNISDRKDEGLIDYVFLALLIGRGNCPAKLLATIFKNYFFYIEMDITIDTRLLE